jgi:serine-type D-Ala-D-Ala carboxypeptidase/endopeptidase (penicillin-binding protein 4)
MRRGGGPWPRQEERDGPRLGRRALLVGLGGTLLSAPWVARGLAEEPLTAILGASGLSLDSGFALVDLATGAVIEAHQPDIDRPPASVVKILTALFALETLGADHRFRTRLAATGPLEGGRLKGDLVLLGGGDPGLDTDALGTMAATVAGAGVTGLAGRVRVDAGALPAIAMIEPDQPAHVGYNPAVAGVNLNFNRVFLEWRPGSAGPVLAFSAPGARHSAAVRSIRAELGGNGYDHRLDGEAEVWRVGAGLARGEGGAWLPVRRPPAYAREVVAALMAGAGVVVPEMPAAATDGAATRDLAAHASAPLSQLMAGMLHHSTNLTAEVAGLAAARAGGRPADSLAHSAGVMSDWARRRYGLERAAFVNHSGLTVHSRMTPREMAAVLVRAEREGLAGLLRERPILDAKGEPIAGPARVRAKTGTLHWVRGLAGYLEARGRRLGFAIFAADLAARRGMAPGSAEPPPGARGWSGRARAQEQALLRRWTALHL